MFTFLPDADLHPCLPLPVLISFTLEKWMEFSPLSAWPSLSNPLFALFHHNRIMSWVFREWLLCTRSTDVSCNRSRTRIITHESLPFLVSVLPITERWRELPVHHCHTCGLFNIFFFLRYDWVVKQVTSVPFPFHFFFYFFSICSSSWCLTFTYMPVCDHLWLFIRRPLTCNPDW